MTHQTGLENRRSGDATEGSNPSLSADFLGFSGDDDAAQGAPFASRSTQPVGSHVGTKWEWMSCPTDFGLLRFDKDLFAAFLERTGVTTGTPPRLPKWCKEESEKGFERAVKLGLEKWTYFARAKYTGRIKIGCSKEPHRRVPALRHARYGEESELLALVRGEHFEKVYHNVFRDWAEGHEWFAPHPDILAEIDRLNSRPATGRQSSAGLTTTKGYIRHGF